MPIKFCRDCLHVMKFFEVSWRCKNHKITATNMVTGKPKYQTCEFQRSKSKGGLCGLKAQYFEPKKNSV